MIINRWIGTHCSLIEGLSQQATPRSHWPYEADWMVSNVRHDTATRCYWIQGVHRNSGDTFFWGHSDKAHLDWRYDLSNAVFEVGRHETPQEARLRHFARKTTA
jgi:hypothetical protein